MFVTCISNTATILHPEIRVSWEDPEDPYSITVGREYPVLGMLLSKNRIKLLLPDDDDALYFPAGLFDLGEWEIPEDWLFRLCSGITVGGRAAWSDPLGAEWGYPELINDPQHGIDLMEREPPAVRIFAKYVKEKRKTREKPYY
jgi:hypothetical protein